MHLRILVVDDEPSLTEALKDVLEANGDVVTTASSAASAIELLRSNDYDLVITDMRMETDTAGFDVVRAAQKHPEDPPTLILTAYPMHGREWRKAGAHGLLTKPISMAVLLDSIDGAVKIRR